ncbi:caspase family protein [Amycolatopsis sp. NPDC004169]|uniref:caspase family protein n=1 Tax=Amycolatopsis sp. NPDC004169 TaxID=3154453 RepID=UPI0033B634CA
MVRRALLIGSATQGLRGPGNDIAAMADVLARRGFQPVVCDGENASRAGILDAYERLISQSRPDDAAVVYYSGHGTYAKDPALADGMPGPGVVQFIVPTDYEQSEEDDFRGIANVELSFLLSRLTERTRNCAVILDCCHSGTMSRDLGTGAVARVWPRAVPDYLARAHLDSLHRHGIDFSRLDAAGNPDAVRIVACAPDQKAHEAHNSDGLIMGYFTDALTRVLGALGPDAGRYSWATVVDRVRQLVLERCGVQRPEAEGPAERELFGTEPVEQVAYLPASRQRRWIRIAGARLLGYGEGDEFAIHHEDDLLGAVVVDWTDGHSAFGELRGPEPGIELAVGARAQVVATAVPALPVFLGTGSSSLVKHVEEDPALRAAAAEETGSVQVLPAPGGSALHDAIGPLSHPKPVEHLLGDLKRIARARAVLRLSEDPGMALPAQVRLELARVVDGVPQPLPTSGAVLHPGQAVCVVVHNDGQQSLYVSLLDVGISAQVTLLNPAHPSGVAIAPGKKYIFGGDDVTGALPGLELGWPPSVPRDNPRRETIVVLISEDRADAVLLQQGGVRTGSTPNRLEQQLRRLGAHDSRELITPALTRAMRFAVRTIDFEVVPAPAPGAERAVFEVDDRPAPVAPSSEAAVPSTVVVRLPALVVHHNRTFRSRDFRLDTLVLTTAADGHTSHHVHTARFSGAVDGTRLAVEGNPLFRGEVRERLDVAMWVSPAPEVDADLSAVSGKSAAELIDSVEALLSASSSRVVGLYRAGFLAGERFGTTRPAAETRVRTADFTFDLTIEREAGRDPSFLG